MSCSRLETVTFELLFILDLVDMNNGARSAMVTWGINDAHEREREWESLCKDCYWAIV